MERISREEPPKKQRKLSSDEQISDAGTNGNCKTPPAKRIKVGSRKSQLALFQSNFVVDRLKEKHADLHYDIIPMSTTGDNVLHLPLSKIGEKSLFTKELEVALGNNVVDMVVHSLKDLPTVLPPGMAIGAICKRENPFDAVVFRKGSDFKDLESLPKGSIIGTSSLRRIAQLKRRCPHLTFQSVRGNLNTRLRKLDEDKLYDALILAVAGLERLDLSSRISCILPSNVCLYAVGQGALAIECKADDESTIKLISDISDKETTLCCIAERSYMRKLEGGCSAPVAICSNMEDEQLTLEGGVFSLDGSTRISATVSETVNGKAATINEQQEIKKKHFCGVVAPHLNQQHLQEAENLGIKLAEALLKKGAQSVLQKAKEQNTIS